MKLFRYISLIVFITALTKLIWLASPLNICNAEFDILCLPFLNQEDGMKLLENWKHYETCHNSTLLAEARLITRWDFLFIVGYVCVITILSYLQMQKEPNSTLNNLLRLNFLLVIIAGILDAWENSILLNNMQSYNIGKDFYSTFYFALFKWILAGWTILIYLFSVIAGRIRSNKKFT